MATVIEKFKVELDPNLAAMEPCETWPFGVTFESDYPCPTIFVNSGRKRYDPERETMHRTQTHKLQFVRQQGPTVKRDEDGRSLGRKQFGAYSTRDSREIAAILQDPAFEAGKIRFVSDSARWASIFWHWVDEREVPTQSKESIRDEMARLEEEQAAKAKRLAVLRDQVELAKPARVADAEAADAETSTTAPEPVGPSDDDDDVAPAGI